MRARRFLASAFAVSAACLLLVAAPAFAAEGEYGDPTFGTNHNGWVWDSASGDQGAVAIRQVADGYIVCSTETGGSAGALIRLQKFDRNGLPVASFGTAGAVVKDGYLSSVVDMTVDTEGRIIVLGGTPSGTGTTNIGVLRFLQDGSDDASFAGDGGLGFGLGLDKTLSPRSLIALPSGELMLAATETRTDTGDITGAVVRISAAGVLGTSVSHMRFVNNEQAVFNKILAVPPSTALPEGGVFIAGTSTHADSGHYRFGWTFLGLGETAVSFLNRGTVQIGFDSDDLASDAVLAGTERIVLAGLSDGYIGVVRTSIEGNGIDPPYLSLDTSFLGSGQPELLSHRYRGTMQVFHINDFFARPWIRAALRNDGRLMLAASVDYAKETMGVLTRLRADGTDDPDYYYVGTGTYEAKPDASGAFSFRTFFFDVLIDAERPVVAGMAEHPATGGYDTILLRVETDSIFADDFELPQ